MPSKMSRTIARSTLARALRWKTSGPGMISAVFRRLLARKLTNIARNCVRKTIRGNYSQKLREVPRERLHDSLSLRKVTIGERRQRTEPTRGADAGWGSRCFICGELPSVRKRLGPEPRMDCFIGCDVNS